MVSLISDMRFLFLSFFVLIGLVPKVSASHVMGGEITWECQGGSYVFTLVFYRDCQGAEVNTVSENLRVWNHPTLTDITLAFVSRTDISPFCTQVAGSPVPLQCGTGANAGNGIGAIEKVIYRSAPVNISGTPPSQGWVFTYENFSRSGSITNLSNPSSYGITLTAKIFQSSSTTGCIDNSPVFLQEPYFVSCSGTPFIYNMNAVDPDLDSLDISFSAPLNNFPSATYNPPVTPSLVPFEPGFSYSSPTPGTSLNPSNVPAQIDPQSGELTFTSYTVGTYVVKVLVRSFRNGQLIGEVEREMQLVVLPCSSLNNAPFISGPFGGLFETTVNAGTLVNFNLNSTDVEVLQDGSPQSNLLSASGPMFGTGFTSPLGCDIAPCATLNSSPIITGTQGVSANFNWQTTCDHLVGADGNGLDMIPYHFVFRVQDDYCQVPKVSYATVTINVVNPGVIQAPVINCIHSNANGDVTIEWTPVADPSGTFVEYQIHSVQSGLLATIPGIITSSWTDPAVTQQNDYFLVVVSGCNGNTSRNSDTISNIYLDLTNPANGTAILDWNDPSPDQSTMMNSYYYVYREYPAGNWTLLDSISYGVTFYLDTIDICDAFLSYQVILGNQPCDFSSNSPGDNYSDMLTPDIPEISSVTIDTLTNAVTITWNQNYQSDTYGYVIYTFDNSGFLYELDTVWGITNTLYTYFPDITVEALSYSVAAFDSCYTPAVPPTFQTSAKAEIHTSIFLEHDLKICDNQVNLSWSAYVGWESIYYEVLGRKNNGPWTSFGSTTNTNLLINVEALQSYCFVVRANNEIGDESFSNRTCLTMEAPSQPDFNYLQVATVNGDNVELRHLIDASTAVSAISIEKLQDDGSFLEIAQLPVTSNNITYVDSIVEVNLESYTYRVRIIDSCGHKSSVSNIGKTILLTTQKDDIRMSAFLQWNPYQDFDGSIVGYNVYRVIDGQFIGSPIASLSADQITFQDDLSNVTFSGNVCYYVEALEGSNSFNDPEISRSNPSCIVFEPIIYCPNAFIPSGINNVFKPVLSNINPSEYRFTIFDRWGQVLFQTNDPIEGWSGYLSNGKLAEVSTYVYMIEVHDGNGLELIKRGHVTLVR